MSKIEHSVNIEDDASASFKLLGSVLALPTLMFVIKFFAMALGHG